MGRTQGLGLFTMLLCAATLSAQTLTVPDRIDIGQDIQIGYSDPARAGQTIVVTINQSMPESVTIEVLIHLDQKGNGSVTWTVPDALSVSFNAPGVKQITRIL